MGLAIGCLLFNLTFAAALPLDFAVGSLATWLAAFNPLVMMGTCFFIIFISKGMVQVRADFGFTNDSIANIVIGLVYFCVIACSFFITYRVVFRKKAAVTDKTKGEDKA